MGKHLFIYLSVCTVFLMDKYLVSSSYANIMNSLVYIISAVASPFVGILGPDWIQSGLV